MFFFTISKTRSWGEVYHFQTHPKNSQKRLLRFKKVFHLDGGDEEISRGDFVPLF